jgi:hypothetical protein
MRTTGILPEDKATIIALEVVHNGREEYIDMNHMLDSAIEAHRA